MKNTTLLLSCFLSLSCYCGLAGTVYVSPAGNDANDGSQTAPVATITKALNLVDAKSDAAVIILSGGTYSAVPSIYIPPQPAWLDPNRPLIIAAAPGETPVLDGSVPVIATAMSGMPGVYVTTLVMPSTGMPEIWQETNRIRYAKAADLRDLLSRDNTYFPLTTNSIAIHPAGGNLPADLRMSASSEGLIIDRNNLTIYGLSLNDFAFESDSAAIDIGDYPYAYVTNIVIDSVNIDNSYVGIVAQNCVDAVLVKNCCISNTIIGVYQRIGTMMVSNCLIANVNTRDSFAFQTPSTVNGISAGIESYDYATNAIINGNTVINFNYSIFNKTIPGGYFCIKHNTLIADYSQMTTGANTYGVEFAHHNQYGKTNEIINDNIINGYSIPFECNASEINNSTINGNILWSIMDFGNNLPRYANYAVANGFGSNLVADPLLAGLYVGEYQPMPNSPANSFSDDNLPVGAIASLTTNDVNTPPSLAISIPYNSNKQWGDYGFPKWNGQELPLSMYDLYLNLWVPTLTVNVTPYSISPVVNMRVIVQTNGATVSDTTYPFTTNKWVFPGTIIPEGKIGNVSFSIQNAAGIWSGQSHLSIYGIPQNPTSTVLLVRSNMQGFLVVATNTARAQQYIQYRVQGQTNWQTGMSSTIYANAAFQAQQLIGLKPLAVVGLMPNTTYEYRIVSTPNMGDTLYTPIKTVTTSGAATTFYVAPGGTDASNYGSSNAPLKTVQYALDLALPGDDIRLLPGTYYGGFILAHGGISNAPITLEADQPLTAALNGSMQQSCVLYLTGATNVIIKGLGIQWATVAGLEISGCQQIEVANNTIYDWYLPGLDTPSASGLVVSTSPNCSIHHNLIYQWWADLVIYSSPNTSIHHNTLVAAALTSLHFGFGSTKGSAVTNNTFNCYSDHAVQLCGTSNDLAQMCFDYNNYGTVFQNYGPVLTKAAPNTFISVAGYPYFGGSRELALWYNNPASPSVYTNYYSLASWSGDHGKDQHSFFADPQWISPRQADFRVLLGSPNLLSSGDYIGAYETNDVIYTGQP